MKILAHVHAYPPMHNAGAEWYLHEIFTWLISRGHTCTVIANEIKYSEFEGVKLIKKTVGTEFAEYRKADIVLTHLDRTGLVLNCCKNWNIPCAVILHNTHDQGFRPKKNIPVIFNSQYVKDKSPHGNNPGVILRPYTQVKLYETKGVRKYITLINCNDNKGGKQFIELAKLLPEFEFVGIEGMYGAQIKDRTIPNLKYLANTPNIGEIYALTKILLMPSEYESWGRTAIEACCSGIPVIANPTDGLSESLSDAGIYIKRNNIKAWAEKIKELMTDKKEYLEAGNKCKKRALELEDQSLKELESVEQFLIKIKERWNTEFCVQ